MHETELKEMDETELKNKLENFWREHGQRVYNLALRILGDLSEAEDVTQETFLRAWTTLKKGREIVSPGSWLTRVAANAALDELRRRRRKRFCEYPWEQELPSVSLAGPEVAVIERELKQEIWRALGRLKPAYRLVLAARTAAGLSTEEVAGVLGASPGYVRVLFNRAANSLRKELLRAIERERGVPPACRECRRLLANPAARNDSLRRAKVEEHLASCPACRKVAEKFRDSYYGLGLLPLAELPARLKAGFSSDPLPAAVAKDSLAPACPAHADGGFGWGKRFFTGKIFGAVAAGILFLGMLALGLTFFAGKHAQNVPSGESGGKSASGLANGGFENGDLTGWGKTWSKTPPGAPDPAWDVSVGTGYAHNGRYGCRIYLAGRSESATAGLCTAFTNESPGYVLWLYLRSGAGGPRSQLCVSFTDLDAKRTVLYRGTVSKAAEANEGDVCFPLQQGVWKEYRFPFAEDYRAKYGTYPGPHRLMAVFLLDSSQGSEPAEVYFDDFNGK